MAKGIPGVADVRYGAVFGKLNGVVATSGSGDGLVLNPAFLTNPATSYLTRNVYNVVPYRLVTDPTTLEYAMFKGTTSLVCRQAATIRNYGFGVLTDSRPGANTCGDTSQRALAPSAASVSAATGTLDNANSEADFTVTGFTSVGTGGAKVYVVATSTANSTITYIANEATPANILAGETDATLSLPYSALRAGSWKLGLRVVPNLPGAATVNTANDLVTRSVAATVTTAKVTGKLNQAGTAVVTVKPSAKGGAVPTGTVSIYRGTSATGSAIATGTLVSGAVTIRTLPAQSVKGSVRLFVVYSGSETYSASSIAVTWAVK
jgi:hypothetical protein